MIKSISLALTLLMVGAISILPSCSKDEPDTPNKDWSQGDTSDEETPSQSPTKSDIQKLIRKHVNVNARYGDYTCYFEIESTIEEALPDHTVKYGIGHGDVDGSIAVSVGNQAYKYSSSIQNGVHIYKFEVPIWFYLMFGVPQSKYDEDLLTTCQIYYNSYLALIKKGINNLNMDEYDLYQEVIGTLSALLKEVRTNYTPSVQLELDGIQYFVCAQYGSSLFR